MTVSGRMGSGGRALCRQWCSLALLLSAEVHPSGSSVPLCVPLPRDSFCRLLLMICVPCVEMEAGSVSSWVPFRRTQRPVPGRSVGGAGGRRQAWGCLCDPLAAARSPQPRVCPAPASPPAAEAQPRSAVNSSLSGRALLLRTWHVSSHRDQTKPTAFGTRPVLLSSWTGCGLWCFCSERSERAVIWAAD